MSRFASFPRGIFVGAVLMYLLDPQRGRARRARLVDAVKHVQANERRLLDKGARDATQRAAGLVERLRHASSDRVDDDVLVARVRSRLGRATGCAHAIEVIAREGRVFLRGHVLGCDVSRVIRETRRVPGVADVVDQLKCHDVSEGVPSLQRRLTRRFDRWSPSARAGALLGGVGLAAWGLFGRRGMSGLAAAAAGAGLALRGALDVPMAQLVTGSEGVEVHKTITVHASIDRVFDLWKRVDNFPRFMHHVQKIVTDPREPMKSRWFVDGPAGATLAFDAVITRIADHKEIAWRTVDGQVVDHSGRVKFTPVLEGTRIEVHMTYRPPGGVLGHALARLLGWDPKARIDDDMIRMKALLEDGQTRAHGRRVAVRDVVH